MQLTYLAHGAKKTDKITKAYMMRYQLSIKIFHHEYYFQLINLLMLFTFQSEYQRVVGGEAGLCVSAGLQDLLTRLFPPSINIR